MSRNALKHGLRSQMAVLPHLERREDWERHRTSVLADLAPVGYVEEALVERIALLLWRLGRVARFEGAAASARYADAEDDLVGGGQGTSSREELASKAEGLRAYLRVLSALPTLPADEWVRIGGTILEDARQAAQVSFDVYASLSEPLCALRIRMEEDTHETWTAEAVREGIRALAEFRQTSYEALLEDLESLARKRLEQAEAEQARFERLLEQRRQQSVLPGEGDVQKIARYESHLSKELYKAVDELRRLQAERRQPEAAKGA